MSTLYDQMMAAEKQKMEKQTASTPSAKKPEMPKLTFLKVGAFGAFLNKYAPIKGGQVIILMGEGK